MSSTGRRRSSGRYLFAGVVFFGLALRILIVTLPGNHLNASWSGSGDTRAYVTLADNLLGGRGFSYAGQPSAFRPPGYALLLAGMKRLFPDHYVVAVRWLQFALGLATVYVCARGSARLFGEQAWQAGLAITLLFPTLLFMTAEVLTECAGAFFSAVFLYLLLEEILRPRLATAAGLGLTGGLAALFRFNMAVLVVIGLWATLRAKGRSPRWQRATLLILFAALVVSPWVVRNLVVFQGRVLYSTQSGLNAVAGVLAPQGRAVPAEEEKLRQTPGWVSHTGLETNDPSRNRLPTEPELNQRGWTIAWKLWGEKGWRLLPLSLVKLTYFWFSADQVFSTLAFPLRQRLLRVGGVVAYWLILFLAVRGWLCLRKRHAEIARMLLVYAILFTALHLPFVMNTRLRVPLMDPMLAMLAGGGWMVLKWQQREAAPAGSLATEERGAGG